MHRTPGLIASAAALALALAGCASTGSTTAATGAQPSAVPSSAPSSEPSAAASSGTCLTKACIARGMDRSLPGIVNTDGSVLTKAVCKASTVKHNPNDSYTVTCVATYTDGSQWRGYGTLLQGKVYFQAVTEVR